MHNAGVCIRESETGKRRKQKEEKKKVKTAEKRKIGPDGTENKTKKEREKAAPVFRELVYLQSGHS